MSSRICCGSVVSWDCHLCSHCHLVHLLLLILRCALARFCTCCILSFLCGWLIVGLGSAYVLVFILIVVMEWIPPLCTVCCLCKCHDYYFFVDCGGIWMEQVFPLLEYCLEWSWMLPAILVIIVRLLLGGCLGNSFYSVVGCWILILSNSYVDSNVVSVWVLILDNLLVKIVLHDLFNNKKVPHTTYQLVAARGGEKNKTYHHWVTCTGVVFFTLIQMQECIPNWIRWRCLSKILDVRGMCG